MAKEVVPISRNPSSPLGKQQTKKAVSSTFYIPKGASNTQLADAVIRDSRAEHAEIAVSSIVPNPRQPRSYIDPIKLQELATSIGKDGLIEEIVVRRSLTQDDIFEIICGERRFRACSEILQWTHMPCTIRTATDAEMLRIALIENEQRQQLSPLDLAAGYQQLYDMVDDQGKRIYSYRSLAAELGKDKDHVSQHLKLVSAPQVLKDLMFEDPTITVRIINELLDVEDASDLEYLMQGVCQHRYKNEDIIFLVGQLKKERAATKLAAASALTSAPEVTTPTGSDETTDHQTSTKQIPSTSMKDVPLREQPLDVRTPSPELALADRKRMLSKDGGQIEKIVKRYKADRSSMDEKEQQAVREAVQQWIETLQDLLK